MLWNPHSNRYLPKHPALCPHAFALRVGEVGVVLSARTKGEFTESFRKANKSTRSQTTGTECTHKMSCLAPRTRGAWSTPTQGARTLVPVETFLQEVRSSGSVGGRGAWSKGPGYWQRRSWFRDRLPKPWAKAAPVGASVSLCGWFLSYPHCHQPSALALSRRKVADG